MQSYFLKPETNLEKLRSAIRYLNAGLVAMFSAIAYVYFLYFGTFHYIAIGVFAVWCSYVQFSIRSRSRSARSKARLGKLQNMGWGIFGTLVIASPIAVPVLQFW